MADTFIGKFTRCAKVHGLFFLDCAFRALIGWAGKLRSRGWILHVLAQLLQWHSDTNCPFEFYFTTLWTKEIHMRRTNNNYKPFSAIFGCSETKCPIHFQLGPSDVNHQWSDGTSAQLKAANTNAKGVRWFDILYNQLYTLSMELYS